LLRFEIQEANRRWFESISRPRLPARTIPCLDKLIASINHNTPCGRSTNESQWKRSNAAATRFALE
jgi:hypothetical protein